MSPSVGLDRLVRVYKALGDRTRLRLVALLADLAPEDALCVNALVAQLDISQPAVSQHLAVLRAADLVIGERRGYHVHYRLNPAALAAYRRQAFALLGEEFVASPADALPPQGRTLGRRAHQAEHRHDERRATVARAGGRRPS